MVNLLDLICRVLISAIFLFSGVNKILNYDSTVQWMEGFNIPGILLMPAIALEVVFPLLIILGYKVQLASSALAIFCILTAFIFHFDFSNQMQIIAFLKNLGLAGGLLFLAINGAKSFSIEKEKKYVRM